MKENPAKKSNNKISRPKNLTFWIILVLIPFIFILLLETGLRIFDYGEDLSLFKQGGGSNEKYMYINRWVAGRYFNSEEIVPDPSNDLFLKDKPENGFRIFVLGGSTAAGWPYPNNIMFPRILNKQLQDAFPDKHIEVINTSISAINTYAQLDFVDEIIDQQPDLILLYTGHNEYYGAFGVASTQSIGNARWLKQLYLSLIHYKTFQLLREFLGVMAGIFTDDSAEANKIGLTLMERLVSEQKIEHGSELYNDGIEQYRDNLSDIFETFSEEDIPVIASHLVSNLKDQSPFISSEGDKNADRFFETGKQLEIQLNLDSAKTAYIKAKDYDMLRFRASEDFNMVIDELAEKYQIPVIQMGKYFMEASFNSIVGSDLMLDHLHPNLAGYFLMAEAFFDKIRSESFISDNWPKIEAVSRDVKISEWGMSNLDIVFANLRLAYLKGGWPFKPAGTVNTAIKDFKFNEKSEQVVLRIWQDPEYTTEDAHADFAAFLESESKYEEALDEYKALVALRPYNYSGYVNVGRILIGLNRKEEALPYLKHSLKLNKTAYAYQWIGITLYEQGEYEEAVSYMAEVYKLDIKEPVLLYCLGAAYAELKNAGMANLMANELQPLAANSQSATQMYLKLKDKIKSIGEK